MLMYMSLSDYSLNTEVVDASWHILRVYSTKTCLACAFKSPSLRTGSHSQLHSMAQSSIPSVAEGRGLEWDNTGGQQQQDNGLSDRQTFGSINIDAGINFLDDWMAQSFDPSIAPFGTGGQQVMSGFDV